MVWYEENRSFSPHNHGQTDLTLQTIYALGPFLIVALSNMTASEDITIVLLVAGEAVDEEHSSCYHLVANLSS